MKRTTKSDFDPIVERDVTGKIYGKGDNTEKQQEKAARVLGRNTLKVERLNGESILEVMPVLGTLRSKPN